MILVKWDDAYRMGDAAIDGEHKILFQLINDFYDAFNESRRRADLSRLLTKLCRYAEEHFQREEASMAAHDYPLLEEHQKVHVALFETIFQLNHRLETDTGPLDRYAVGFLRYWLVDHISAHDKKFGLFLAKAKAAAPASASVSG